MGRAEASSAAMELATDRTVEIPSTATITRTFIDIVFVIFSSTFGRDRLQLELYEKQCPTVMGVESRLCRENCPRLSWLG